jgi:hypothetical protein
MHQFLKFIWYETLHVSNKPSVHHQELFTVHSAMVYVMQVCRQISSVTLLESCLQNCITYNIDVFTVKVPDDGWRNCPKHVEFHSKINLRIWCIYLVLL